MNRWRRLVEQEGHARHSLARAAALVSTEREAEVALVSAGYTATKVRALIAATQPSADEMACVAWTVRGSGRTYRGEPMPTARAEECVASMNATYLTIHHWTEPVTGTKSIEGASPRTTLDGARDVLAGIDRGARAAAHVNVEPWQDGIARARVYGEGDVNGEGLPVVFAILDAHGEPARGEELRAFFRAAESNALDDMARGLARCCRKPARPWLDAAIFGFRDYPRTLTGYLSASERHVGAAVAASMSGAEADMAMATQWGRDVEAHS